MEQINTIELNNPLVYPDTIVLKSILGDSYEVYETFLDFYKDKGMEFNWKYYKDGKAWLCKVQMKKKTIMWISAWKGYMQATIYIQDKYIDRVDGLMLQENTKKRILSAKRVGRSIPCMFELKTKNVLKELEDIIMLKVSFK